VLRNCDEVYHTDANKYVSRRNMTLNIYYQEEVTILDHLLIKCIVIIEFITVYYVRIHEFQI
jgi:hypothetical protein